MRKRVPREPGGHEICVDVVFLEVCSAGLPEGLESPVVMLAENVPSRRMNFHTRSHTRAVAIRLSFAQARVYGRFRNDPEEHECPPGLVVVRSDGADQVHTPTSTARCSCRCPRHWDTGSTSSSGRIQKSMIASPSSRSLGMRALMANLEEWNQGLKPLRS